MLQETHIHIKTGNIYGVFGYGKVKIDGEWHDAVFYSDSLGDRYCRTQKNFEEKFKPIG